MPTRPPTHKPRRARLSDGRPSASARGYDAHWRRLRLVVLEARPMCEAPGCNRPAEHVDHRDGDVLNLSEANLVPLCHGCHSRKTIRHDGGFGRQKRRKAENDGHT